MIGSGTNPLAYHLTEALFSMIFSADSKIYRRLNLTAFIYGCIEAMLSETEEEKENLKEFKRRITLLRQSYEPIMDISPYVFEKKIAFEIYLDQIVDDLLKTINDYELVNPRILQEVYAARWGER
jgi:hypothetical protein